MMRSRSLGLDAIDRLLGGGTSAPTSAAPTRSLPVATHALPQSRVIFVEGLGDLRTIDQFIVAFSGGKDSTAVLIHLLELGIPREKIELGSGPVFGSRPLVRESVDRPRPSGSPARADRRKEKKEHDAIVALARKIRAEKYTSCPVQGACFWHALAVIEAAKRRGRHLVLQAGSASWRRVPERLDDGVSATHFSYVWEPDSPLTRAIIARFFAGDHRMLPEMHVWAGDPATQELIDITTRYWPEQCKSLTGADWLGPKPPDYLWTSARDLPDDAVYEPDMRATVFAGKLAMLQGPK